MSQTEPEYASDPILEALRPETTGNMLVTFRRGTDLARRQEIIALMVNPRLQERSAPMARFEIGETGEGLAPLDRSSPARLYRHLGAAVIRRAAGINMAALSENLSHMDEVLDVRPEYYVYPLSATPTDTAGSTWGLKACNVTNSPFTGKGIKVAVLDTGLDRGHPDFQNNLGSIVAESFVDGEDADDIQGHGTHCAGTVGGPRQEGPAAVPGFGCAPHVDLHIGKVLSNRGFGTEESVIAGMDWALDEGCNIISMSLGIAVRRGESYQQNYEEIAAEALDLDTLVIAAAGNDSDRASGRIAPVGSPANSPSIMAVGAIDANYQPASFSNGGMNGNGGGIDIVAPGVAVFSSAPRPMFYKVLSGTSMACPHVAGVAALGAESDPPLRGRALWNALVGHAKPIQGLPRDIGAGLVQAPSSSQTPVA